MRSDLNESIKHNDLRGLISQFVSIDQYKSKMGEDENIVVIAFKINGKDPADDLSQYIESGFSVLDVDKSPGPDSDGVYTVFVELERNSDLFNKIDTVLHDVSQVDNDVTAWKFTSYESNKILDWNQENFQANVIDDSYDYVIAHDETARAIATDTEGDSEPTMTDDQRAIAERIRFLNKY